jgi:predicted metal-dependent phosphoesterase TrpH
VGVRIDLHTHSTASDGTDTPVELMLRAVASGLDVIGLTDHDTTVGWQTALDALPPGLGLVTGAEFSCSVPDGNTDVAVHMLAYLFDPTAPIVLAEQIRQRDQRRARFAEMARRLAADGFPIDPDELLACPGTAALGRPHLGRALVRAGLVGSVSEAFERFLYDGGPYHVARPYTRAPEVIEMVRAAGGVTVLAHARSVGRGPTPSREAIHDLVAHGLDGVEVDHPEHDRAARRELTELAEEHDLLVTGSSDYHGANKSVALGAETTRPEMLERLVTLAGGARPREVMWR